MIGASPWDEHPRRPLRLAVAAAGLLSVAGLFQGILAHRAADVVRRAVPGVEWARRPLAVLLLSAAAGALLVAFARGRRSLEAGLSAFALLAWMSAAYDALGGDAAERFHVPAAVLLAWCLGLGLARLAYGAAAEHAAERVAEGAAAGALFAPYLVSALIKLATAGTDWVHGNALRAFLLASARFEPGSLRGELFDWVVNSPSLAGWLIGLALAAQLVAGLAIAGRWPRVVAGLLLLAFHAALWVLVRRAYPENMLLLAAFSLPWPALVRGWRATSEPATEEPGPGAGRRVAVAVAVVVAAAAAASRIGSGARPVDARSLPRASAGGTATAPVASQHGAWKIQTTRHETEGAAYLEVTDGTTKLWALVPATPDMPMASCGPESLAPRDAELLGKPFRYRADDDSASHLDQVLPLLTPDATTRTNPEQGTPPGDEGADAAPGARRNDARRRWPDVIKKLLVSALLLGFAGAAGVAGLFWYYGQDLPRLESLADYRPPQVTKVYAADGTTLIGEVFEERRTVVPVEEIPAVMVQALVSAEDKNFFQHSGIDYLGTLKAAVGNLMPGARTRGASTLTQQIVKQMLLSNERKLSRKIKEAILAHRLEANFSKQDILYLYLNQIFFGNNRYGIEEASRLYFGKSARELEVGEAAILASIPKDPNVVNPRANVKRVKERQAYVLRQMVENGYIAEAVAVREAAKPLPVQVNPDPPPGGYYVEEVKRILTEKLGEERLKLGGLRVDTAMDPKLQKAAEDAMREGLRELDKRQGWRGARTTVLDRDWDRLSPLLQKRREAALARVPPEAGETDVMDLRGIEFDKLPKADADELSAQARAVRFRKLEVGTEVVALVKSSDKKAATIDLGGFDGTVPFTSLAWARKFNPAAYTAPPKGADDVLDPGDVVLVRVAKLVTCEDAARAKGKCTGDVIELALEQTPQVEGALVSIDPNTRHVTALVGGYDHRRSPFNRATQAKRQPGSSFKPFVYAAALEQGQLRALLPPDAPEEVRTRCIVFHPRQTVYDTPEVIRDKWTGKPWEPRNFERDFFAGPLSLRVALAESKNTVAVKLVAETGCQPELPLPFEEMQQAGLDRVKDLARRAGIDSPIPDSITAALGSGEVVPAELVNAYATLAMEGRYAPPVFIKRVRSPDGETLYEEKPRYEQPPSWLPEQGPLPAYTGRGLRPEVAFVTGQVMRSVVEDPGGTARSLLALGRPIAGKTGTASEHRDAWFVGFTPEVVTGVWVGFDDHQMLGARETGGHAAGPVWLKYMRVAEELVEHLDWTPPMGVVTARIDPRTGLLADEHAPLVDTEYYLQGTEPTEQSAPADQAPAPTEDTLRGDGP